MLKMALELGDDFCPPCEPIARIWHKGNDPIRRRLIATVDIYLQEVQHHQLARQVADCSTHSFSCLECPSANRNIMSI